jgi:hypothetical protein
LNSYFHPPRALHNSVLKKENYCAICKYSFLRLAKWLNAKETSSFLQPSTHVLTSELLSLTGFSLDRTRNRTKIEHQQSLGFEPTPKTTTHMHFSSLYIFFPYTAFVHELLLYIKQLMYVLSYGSHNSLSSEKVYGHMVDKCTEQFLMPLKPWLFILLKNLKLSRIKSYTRFLDWNNDTRRMSFCCFHSVYPSAIFSV